MTVTDLRQKYPVFLYQSAKWQVTNNQLVAQFQYSANDSSFQHQVSLPINSDVMKNLDSNMIDQLVFSLGMIESLSYWKAFCSPLIVVEAGPLSDWQIQWWHTVLIEGMGEYFYVNHIDFTGPDFVKIVLGTDTSQRSEPTAISQLPVDQTRLAVDLTVSDPLAQLNQSSTSNTNQAVTVSNQSGVSDTQPSPHGILIPLGGGKDSIVTVELLKLYQAQNSQVDLAILMVNPTEAARAVGAHSQLPTLTVTRTLDPLLLDLNARGFLNGHVPFSASLAFISTLTAYLHQYNSVALSNEASANEASLTYLDRPINHQYSKSFAFEQLFAQYLDSLTKSTNQQLTDTVSSISTAQSFQSSTVTTSPADHSQVKKDKILNQVQDDGEGVQHDEVGATQTEQQVLQVNEQKSPLPTYFSLLRPLTELQIAQLFAQLGQPYFPLFRSCNQGSKTNVWCGHCAKCLFTYLMLSPFLDQATLQSIFGQNLLDNASLLSTLHALIGTSPDKPLDCVGLRQESLVACYLTLQRFDKTDHPLPFLVTAIKTELMTELSLNQEAHALLKSWNPEHLVPKDLEELLKKCLFQGT